MSAGGHDRREARDAKRARFLARQADRRARYGRNRPDVGHGWGRRRSRLGTTSQMFASDEDEVESHVMSCHVMSVMSWHGMAWHVVSCHVIM